MEEIRRSSTKRMYLWGIGLVFFVLFCVAAGVWYMQKEVYHRSPLHQLLVEMGEEANNWKMPGDIPFSEDSAEKLFLVGLEKFGAGDYEGAARDFKGVLERKGEDPALKGYTLFFLNETEYIFQGVGNISMVEQLMEELTYYPPFKEELLWTTVLTIGYDPQLRAKGIKMLEDYLRINQDLKVEDWAAVKNTIAMMEYQEGNYSKSIREFYDVQLRLEAKTLNERLTQELVFAREYIANIYYYFEDYEGVIELYNRLIDAGKKSGDYNIYSHYINLSTAYLEVGEIDKAKTTIKELDFLIPDMDQYLREEIKGSILDVLANIAMAENNYVKAGEYITEAIELYEERSRDVFYEGWYHVELTYCKYLLHEKQFNQVIQRLEEMNQQGYAKEYGIEREVYENLLIAYEKTGNIEKQIEIYRQQLDSEIEKESNIKKEYLNFSKYYKDANRLQSTNVKLAKTNSISFLIICFSVILYMAIFYFIRIIKERDITDQLTGVYNRKKLGALQRKYQQKGTPAQIAVVMADIDAFKKYNDTYGHMQGDEVLKDVAEILTNSVRSCDEVIRYGGEEFILLLNEVEKETVVDICERVQRKLKQTAIVHETSEVKPYVTISAGICIQKEKNKCSLPELIEIADEQLYEAKKQGRDCFRVKEV